jgi:transaldolase
MQYSEYGFSLWCDFIEREFIDDQFVSLIESDRINGATSNPAIFQNAINNSEAYAEQKSYLQGTQKQKYEALAIEDIKRAAKKLLPLYEAGNDGFVSIEVDPTLCDDSFGTIEEGTRLFEAIGMPNVMIKVPATEAGYVAMRELSAHGIHINATLVFSPEQAKECFIAINEGMSKSAKETKAVISVFVSRFDRLVDSKLDPELRGKLGIANAMSCYHFIEEGDNENIKTLFASTGVKGDELAPEYYIKELLLPHSVNTAPLATIDAFINAGDFEQAPLLSQEEIVEFMVYIKKQGVDIEEVYENLINDGLEAFKESFADMISKL